MSAATAPEPMIATVQVPQWLAKLILENLEEIGDPSRHGPLNWWDSAVQAAGINARSLRTYVELGEAAFEDYLKEGA